MRLAGRLDGGFDVAVFTWDDRDFQGLEQRRRLASMAVATR